MAARRVNPSVCARDGNSVAAVRTVGVPREQIAEIQRTRLLAAAIGALEEIGYERMTVGHITGRARVSRRTFYDVFANREECVAAALEHGAARVKNDLSAAGLAGRPWRERMRCGLWTMLCFCEREPALARTIVVHSLHGSGPVRDAREAIVAQLVAAVDEGRRAGTRATGCTVLTAEGVVGATLAILHARLSRSDDAAGENVNSRQGKADARRSSRAGAHPADEGTPRLAALLGELTAIVLLPYEGATIARRERARSAPATPAQKRGPRLTSLAGGDPLAGLPMRLTYRTARVLEAIARQPGASNRQVAAAAEIADQGQVSKLLARLQRLGLVANQGDGRQKGEPNAWTLTELGAHVAHSLGAYTPASTPDGRGADRPAPRRTAHRGGGPR